MYAFENTQKLEPVNFVIGYCYHLVDSPFPCMEQIILLAKELCGKILIIV